MITRDYLLRLIHQLSQVLARVLKLAELKHFSEAFEEIRLSSGQLLGMDDRMLTSLSDSEFIRLFSLGDRFDVEKCVIAAELLRIAAEVSALEGNETASYHSRLTSLSLFLEVHLREAGALPNEYLDPVNRLIEALSIYELPLSLRQKTFRYYEHTGRFDRAENVLFEILQQEPGFVSEGLKFYARLRTMSDDQLSRGGLPRNEVEEGLEKLKRRSPVD